MFETGRAFNQTVDNVLRSTAMRQLFSTPVSAAAVIVILASLIFYFLLSDKSGNIEMTARNGMFAFIFLTIGMGLYHTVNLKQIEEKNRSGDVQAVLDTMKNGAAETSDYVPVSGAFQW